MNAFFKILFSLFLAFCVGVHVYGLITHFIPESNISHVIHIVSYSLCLLAVVQSVNYSTYIYVLGALYPFFYHARCAWDTYQTYHTFNGICLLVVVLMPLIGVFVTKQKRPAL